MTTVVTVTVADNQVDVTEATPGNTQGRTTTLKTRGEARTFYAHSGNALGIAERSDLSESAVDQMNVGGSARELTDEDFEKAGLSSGVKGDE